MGAKVLQLLGTESDSGKTQILSGLISIFREHKPFPFKAQNMSLNSYVGSDNGEMAFAQAYQSMVAGIEPVSVSNPVLLKPVARSRTEVIFLGKSSGIFDAKDYWFKVKQELKEKVFSIFSELIDKRDLLFVEGAGSCSEVNLKKSDFSNLSLARKFNIPFILITDIERGGVFAKLIGSYELMTKKERELFLGIIINKMSGDSEILREGIRFIQKKTGKKVIGVIPYDFSITLPEEDSMGFLRIKNLKNGRASKKELSIKVVMTKYISNFFDFYPFEIDSKYNEQINFSFARFPEEIDGADVVILAGSRNVFYDIYFLKESGFYDKIIQAVDKGKFLIGICGGYEMMFEKIQDIYGIESNGETEGFGFFKGTIKFEKNKKVFWERIHIDSPWFSGEIKGFNIRHGVGEWIFLSKDNIFGTFLHGIFWNDAFREGLYNYFGVDYTNKFSQMFGIELKRWSDLISNNVDIDFIRNEIGL